MTEAKAVSSIETTSNGNGWFEKAKNWLWDSKNTIIFVIILLIVWEGGVRLFNVARYILPPLSSIFEEFISHAQLIWKYAIVTGIESLVGYMIAVVLGVPLAMFIGFSRLMRQTF
jgi:NitT/TauT family transport system permease protein